MGDRTVPVYHEVPFFLSLLWNWIYFRASEGGIAMFRRSLFVLMMFATPFAAFG
jgi:hypothetical protein